MIVVGRGYGWFPDRNKNAGSTRSIISRHAQIQRGSCPVQKLAAQPMVPCSSSFEKTPRKPHGFHE
jgi:hypothetical protein